MELLQEMQSGAKFFEKSKGTLTFTRKQRPLKTRSGRLLLMPLSSISQGWGEEKEKKWIESWIN